MQLSLLLRGGDSFFPTCLVISLNYFALNKEIKIYRKDTKGKEKCSRKEKRKLLKDEGAGKEI